MGYFGPDSVTWRIMAEPATMVGGLRALLLQALHPEAMALMHVKTTFRDDPWARLQRTTEFVATVTYAPRDEVDRAAARVRAIHRRLGIGAADQLAWVHACEVDSLMVGARRAGVRVGPADADRFVAEQAVAGSLVGVPADLLPRSAEELQRYLTDMRPRLRLTEPAITAFRYIVAPPMPVRVQWLTPARAGWTALSTMAVGLLPRWARRMYGLPGLRLGDLGAAAGMRALRLGTGALPASLTEGPHYRAARERLAHAS